jgi:hypothetical protein
MSGKSATMTIANWSLPLFRTEQCWLAVDMQYGFADCSLPPLPNRVGYFFCEKK